MEFVHSVTELTTAATDLLLALVALVCIYLLQSRLKVTARLLCWIVIFSCLVVAAFFGAIAHGIELTDQIKNSLWMLIYLSLALLVSMFVVAVCHDVFGLDAAKRLFIPAALIAIAFFVYATQFSSSFLPFIIYEVVAMLVALLGYVWLLARGFLGAHWFVAGIVLTIVAAAIQATQALTFSFIWAFDHNGVYHLLQLIAVLMLCRGVMVSGESRP